MKTPPLLLGASLMFWGWQTGFILPALIMGAVLEAARFVPSRWDLSDEEFSRVWTFCSVLLLAAVILAFSVNNGPSQLGRLLHAPTPANQSNAGVASARTATALFRWLPMIFFLFVAAQAYSIREEIPLTTMSRILRWRWRQSKDQAPLPPAVPGVNVGFPYFGLCLFAASNHSSETTGYFWGCSALVTWGLWSFRSRRYRRATWAGAVMAAVLLSYGGQRYLGHLQGLISNLDPQLFSRFVRSTTNFRETQTALGQVGRRKLSGRIVIRLRPEIGSVPQYLREASYRTFKTPIWSSGEAQDELSPVNPESNLTTWILLPEKTNPARMQISCYLTGVSRDGEPRGVLPLPVGTERLEEFPVFSVKKSPTAAVVAEGPSLVIFDAIYGSGATLDAPPDPSTNRLDLLVPNQEAPAVRRIAAGLAVDKGTLSEKLQAVRSFFRENFSYSFWQGRPRNLGTNETALSRFLLRTHSGHCEYFATATVLLLRQLGVPARYAVGYAVHESSGKGYVVRERDAHAWCLAWDEQNRIWQDIDTTPGSWIREESDRASPLEWLMDGWSWISFQFSKFLSGQTHLRRYALIALIPILGLMLYQIVFRKNRRWRRRTGEEPEPVAIWPGKDSEFYRVERLLARRGLARRPEELLSGWLERALHEPGLAPVKSRLLHLLDLHYRFRFDPVGLNLEDRRRLKQEAQAVHDELEHS
jgi:transglutaminase-like putative cysteine protease